MTHSASLYYQKREEITFIPKLVLMVSSLSCILSASYEIIQYTYLSMMNRGMYSTNRSHKYKNELSPTCKQNGEIFKIFKEKWEHISYSWWSQLISKKSRIMKVCEKKKPKGNTKLIYKNNCISMQLQCSIQK